MKESVIQKPRKAYVPHPRYGSRPRVTGLDVTKETPGVYIGGWTAHELETRAKEGFLYCIDPAQVGCLIPGTAIASDPSKQVSSPLPVTHYYDIERKCRDCGQWYIFFAEEQKYWYEELQFPLDADCVRCSPCRKQCQKLDLLKARYDELAKKEALSLSDEVEMAATRLDLVEAGVFHSRQIEKVRTFVNRHGDHEKAEAIRMRLSVIMQER